VLQSATLVSIFVLVGLWEYCMFFYRQGKLPYSSGFNTFSMFQWIIIGAALIKMFGWLFGLIGLGLCAFVLQYVTHFTLGLVFNVVFKGTSLPALAFFASMVWITAALTVALLIFG